MFGSFLPSLGCLAAIKSTQVEGADIVMKSSRFRDRRVTGVARSGRQTSHNQTSGQSLERRTCRSAAAQDYLLDGVSGRQSAEGPGSPPRHRPDPAGGTLSIRHYGFLTLNRMSSGSPPVPAQKRLGFPKGGFLIVVAPTFAKTSTYWRYRGGLPTRWEIGRASR